MQISAVAIDSSTKINKPSTNRIHVSCSLFQSVERHDSIYPELGPSYIIDIFVTDRLCVNNVSFSLV